MDKVIETSVYQGSLPSRLLCSKDTFFFGHEKDVNEEIVVKLCNVQLDVLFMFNRSWKENIQGVVFSVGPGIRW